MSAGGGDWPGPELEETLVFLGPGMPAWPPTGWCRRNR